MFYTPLHTHTQTVCMYVCMVHACMYVCMYPAAHDIHTRVYKHIYVQHIHTHTHMHIHVHTHKHIHLYMHTYVCICVHTHSLTQCVCAYCVDACMYALRAPCMRRMHTGCVSIYARGVWGTHCTHTCIHIHAVYVPHAVYMHSTVHIHAFSYMQYTCIPLYTHMHSTLHTHAFCMCRVAHTSGCVYIHIYCVHTLHVVRDVYALTSCIRFVSCVDASMYAVCTSRVQCVRHVCSVYVTRRMLCENAIYMYVYTSRCVRHAAHPVCMYVCSVCAMHHVRIYVHTGHAAHPA